MYPLAESALGPNTVLCLTKTSRNIITRPSEAIWAWVKLITKKPRHFKVIKPFCQFCYPKPPWQPHWVCDQTLKYSSCVHLIIEFFLWLFKLFWTFYPGVQTEDDSSLKPHMFILSWAALEGAGVACVKTTMCFIITSSSQYLKFEFRLGTTSVTSCHLAQVNN